MLSDIWRDHVCLSVEIDKHVVNVSLSLSININLASIVHSLDVILNEFTRY